MRHKTEKFIKFMIINSEIEVDFDFDNLLENLNSEYKIVDDNEIYDPHTIRILKILNEDIIYTITMKYANFKNYKKLEVILEKVDVSENYDDFLERLKNNLNIKIIESWEKSRCFWITDTQSEMISQKLYIEINKTENLLRNFLNVCMIENIGIHWWDKISAEKFGTEFIKMKSQKYKEKIKSFKNIEDSLMTLTAEELKDVMQLQIKKWEPIDIKKLEQFLKFKDKNNFYTEALKGLNERSNLWDSVFKNYFDESFLKRWSMFCIERNQIAHNKLIDYNFFEKTNRNLNEINKAIEMAEICFDKKNISEEEKEILEIEFLETQEIEKNIAESESGVVVRDRYDIIEKFEGKLIEFKNQVDSECMFDEGVTINYLDLDLASKFPLEFINIKSNVSIQNNELKIYIKELDIEDSPGATSYVQFNIELNEQIKREFYLEYINGESEFNYEQSSYYPVTEDSINDIEFEDFIEDTIKFIKDNFKDLDSIIEESKDKEVIFIDSYCENCGEEAVLNKEVNELLKGECLSCGYKNDISCCDRDGIEFIKNEDNELDLCPHCQDYLSLQMGRE